jgi:hypothetical protein
MGTEVREVLAGSPLSALAQKRLAEWSDGTIDFAD